MPVQKHMTKKPAAMTKKPASKYTRLTPFARGMIFMGFLVGMTYPEIRTKVHKDGVHLPSKQTISDTIAMAESHGDMYTYVQPVHKIM